ncbi:MAG: 3-deoxy-D-manno-octulosonic acid transferase, partial [Thioalkalivibrio sp.]|nr:3-deoxy-D-manno-octulosonic acid transferase [Thioalkalivibrio sp.]
WVPRHRAQFDVAERLSREAGYGTARRSRGAAAPVDVLIGDTFGETGTYIQAADVAFVGGSLVPLGGQNLLEPAALGVPVVTGPSTEHFAAAAHLLETAGALERVADADALGQTVSRLLGDADLRLARGTSAREATASARGPVLRVAELVEQWLPALSAR